MFKFSFDVFRDMQDWRRFLDEFSGLPIELSVDETNRTVNVEPLVQFTMCPGCTVIQQQPNGKDCENCGYSDGLSKVYMPLAGAVKVGEVCEYVFAYNVVGLKP